MASIDTRYRKPRRTRGTPLFKLRYYVTGALGLYALVFGTIIAISPFMRATRESMDIIGDLYQDKNLRQSRSSYDLESEMERLHSILKIQNKHRPNSTEKKE